MECLKDYQILCKNKINLYNINTEHRLNTINDGTTWWALAREIKGQVNTINPGISADKFLEYFSQLLNPKIISVTMQYAENHIIDDHLDMPITLEEIKLQLNRTKPNKAPGEDRIPYEFFVHATDEYLKTLATIYTRLLESTGDFEIFRKTIIYPVHKKGDINSVNNYRGIAFMNCIGKILMGIVNKRLNTWVERNNALNEYQAGFRKGYSATDNIYNLTSIIQIKFSENRRVYAFFVNFKLHLTVYQEIYLFISCNKREYPRGLYIL